MVCEPGQHSANRFLKTTQCRVRQIFAQQHSSQCYLHKLDQKIQIGIYSLLLRVVLLLTSAWTFSEPDAAAAAAWSLASLAAFAVLFAAVLA